MPRRFATKLKMPADGVSLADEPEDVKGVRMLRVLRQFARSKNGVMAIELDGQLICLVKYDPVRHPNADTTPDGVL
jgi:hypothetical protein